MRNEIDYKKLELCMVDLFCDLNWNMYDRKSIYHLHFVTNGGQVISSKILQDLVGLNDNKVPPSHQDMIDYVGELFKMEVKVLEEDFIKTLKMCRVSIPMRPQSLETRNRFNLNIESHYPLTYFQRRFLLDIIEIHSISPDKIFIEDHSKEQCIKRQLGLHFFEK